MCVDPGTYVENLVIDKPLSLIGLGSGLVILDVSDSTFGDLSLVEGLTEVHPVDPRTEGTRELRDRVGRLGHGLLLVSRGIMTDLAGESGPGPCPETGADNAENPTAWLPSTPR